MNVSVGIERAAEVLAAGGVAVLSGAGISTDSGIPDYRGAGPRRRPHVPMTYADFVGSVSARRRYWARSYRGWPLVGTASSNTGHAAITELERQGAVSTVITQNVDGLHHAAGSREVLELHGSLARVVCLGCGDVYRRHDVQERLATLNPTTRTAVPADAGRPDGDVELPALSEADVERFRVPTCRRCGGTLKPDVVFFGERVPEERGRSAAAVVARAPALLVVGSSLTVYSGRRFAVQAAREGKPIVIVNRGPTRADHLAAVKVDASISAVLPLLARHTSARPIGTKGPHSGHLTPAGQPMRGTWSRSGSNPDLR